MAESVRGSRARNKSKNEGQLYMTAKEQRQFQMAMRNSLVETANVNSNINEIEEMKTFWPSEDQFRDPLLYIEQLMRNEDVNQYGCIKIVAPPSFRPQLAFDTQSQRKIPTRYQVLQELSQGKAFKQNNVGRSYAEFESLAAQHEEPLATKEDFDQLEKHYWDMVENQVGPQMRVEYAADVPTG